MEETMQEVLDSLVGARALITDEAHWCQLHYSRNITVKRFLRSPRVHLQYCAVGALNVSAGASVTLDDQQNLRDYRTALRILDRVAIYYFGSPMITVNDNPHGEICTLHSAHENVMFIFDKAIAAVEEIMGDQAAAERMEFDILMSEAEPVPV